MLLVLKNLRRTAGGAVGAVGGATAGVLNIEKNELFFLELGEFVAGTAGAEEFIYFGNLYLPRHGSRAALISTASAARVFDLLDSFQ